MITVSILVKPNRNNSSEILLKQLEYLSFSTAKGIYNKNFLSFFHFLHHFFVNILNSLQALAINLEVYLLSDSDNLLAA